MSLSPAEIAHQTAHISDNLQPNIYAAIAICLPAAWIAVGLRLFARRLKRVALGVDDYTIIVALVFTSAFVACCIQVTKMGMGRHAILMKPDNFVHFAKGTLAAEILYNPAIFTIKLSILLLYRKLFPSYTFKKVLWGLGAFVLAYSIAAAMVNLLQCLPVRALWTPTVVPYCVNLSADLITLSSINVVTDFVLLALPITQLWRLQISRNRKLQLMGIFLLGGFVCIVSIVRATYVSAVSIYDGPWNNSYGALWSVVETCIGVVSACLPTLRPVIQYVKYGDANRDESTSAMSLTKQSDYLGRSGNTGSGYDKRPTRDNKLFAAQTSSVNMTHLSSTSNDESFVDEAIPTHRYEQV